MTDEQLRIQKKPMPKRVQRKRTSGWRKPDNTISVCRPGKWGNPYSVKEYGREKAVELFREYIGHPNSPHAFKPDDIKQLQGKNLMCWCPLDKACHADVLLELANK
jgi:hypothetical protein